VSKPLSLKSSDTSSQGDLGHTDLQDDLEFHSSSMSLSVLQSLWLDREHC
jgi:hypothetical protein